MFISRSYQQDLQEKRSSTDKRFLAAGVLILTVLMMCSCAGKTETVLSTEGTAEEVFVSTIDDVDVNAVFDVNSVVKGVNFWNLYFFDGNRQIYVDRAYESGVDKIILQAHSFSYNKVGDTYLYDVYVNGVLESEHNVYTNMTDKADFCEIEYDGGEKGITSGRYTFVIYNVNSQTEILCVAYCVVN